MNDILSLANAMMYSRDTYESDNMFCRFIYSTFTFNESARPKINMLDSIFIKRVDIDGVKVHNEQIDHDYLI